MYKYYTEYIESIISDAINDLNEYHVSYYLTPNGSFMWDHTLSAFRSTQLLNCKIFKLWQNEIIKYLKWEHFSKLIWQKKF